MTDKQNAFYKKGEDATTGIVFADRVTGFAQAYKPGRVLHILCLGGGMSFMLHDVRYNIAARDYVILPDAALATAFTESPDAEAIVMSLSESFVASLAGSAAHLFRDEMLGHLLMAHVLDLYDIHARNRRWDDVPERAQSLLRRFIGMLYGGEYIAHRDLAYYASRLCVTPHYLSEICRKASGRPASYWLDRFTVNEVTRLLLDKSVPLADIAARMNFSSLSYFSRYVQKHTGLSPSDYRRSHA